MPKTLSWFAGGLLLGTVFFLSVFLIKPIGVSTEFVIADGIIWNAIDPDIVIADENSKSGYSSPNAYLASSDGKMAKAIEEPVSYGALFVVSLIVGSFLSALLKGDKPEGQQKTMPEVWEARFGNSAAKRYIAVFVAGFIVLFGARLAGGCTSGHMMSGIMQMSVSGFMFAAGAFIVGIPFAALIFNKKTDTE
ncbi:MAG TPA: YeeE/YedE thiosulfate transporter family protein [Alphaproteobacteria bacterium]|nr:YeeE/YedE family protein [Alphaproteobacteria bacterium]HOO51748.1 YeeE/YedE thiosulfate transporter family protein [Alphaproteobacteria bacterium]